MEKESIIQAILTQSSTPCCYISKKHIGMTLEEFLFKYQGTNVHYASLYIGSLEIEIRSYNATTTCHIVDNVCVESYIFYDNDFAFFMPDEFLFDTTLN